LLLGIRLLPGLLRGGERNNADAATGAATANQTYGFMPQTMTVAGVTLANGGDNFGVYIPFFAAAPAAIPTYIAVFAVMTAAWCALGYFVVNNPLLGVHLRRYGDVLLPAVLIPLGLYILSGAMPLLR
jgi:cadmium resistance protein CadD (predicted permease)